jgi:hypothetical protein
MMKKFTVLFLSFLAGSYSQDISKFPLWGSAWIIAQGINNQVYPSALPLVPGKVAILDFTAKDKTAIYWANLCHKPYRCTAELIADIKRQIELNHTFIDYADIGRGEVINIDYQPYDDTVWSGDDDAKNFLTAYQKIGRKTTNTDSLFDVGDINKLHSAPLFTREKPVYYGVRYSTPTDRLIYTIESSDEKGNAIYLENKNYLQRSDQDSPDKDVGKVDLQQFRSGNGFQNYCSGNTIFEQLPVKYSVKTSQIGFWQVHVHTEVWYFPRDPFDGTPLIKDALKMDYATAAARKKQSIDNPDNIDLKYYRNPYLSDSASTIISFAFINFTGINSLTLNSLSLCDTLVDINHFPPKMYRISNLQTAENFNNYKTALYQLYSKSEEEEKRAREIDLRCPGWEITDLKNADLIYPAARQQPGILVRDATIDNGIFSYNDCPCSGVPGFKNLTPVQLQKLAYLAPPLCDYSEMVKAVSLYKSLYQILTLPLDRKTLLGKINSLNAIINDRDRKSAQAGIDWHQHNGACAQTWVSQF